MTPARGAILAEGLRDLWVKPQLSVGGGAGLQQHSPRVHSASTGVGAAEEQQVQMATLTAHTSQCLPDKAYTSHLIKWEPPSPVITTF